MNGMTITPLFTGIDLRGLSVAVYPGQIAVMHFFHNPDCPGCHGRPDLCHCSVETRVEIVGGSIAEPTPHRSNMS